MESENYLFLYLDIDAAAEPGRFDIILKDDDIRVVHEYELKQKNSDPEHTKGFSPADAIYLVTPDRFANGDPSNDSVEGLSDRLDRDNDYGRHGGDLVGLGELHHVGYDALRTVEGEERYVQPLRHVLEPLEPHVAEARGGHQDVRFRHAVERCIGEIVVDHITDADPLIAAEIGDIALIVGSGPIGAMHILLARLAGASKILVADVVASRLDLAAKLGADATINSAEQNLEQAVMELTDGHGADFISTACPIPQVQEQVMQIAADHARINFFGGLPKGKEHISFNSNLVHYKELILTGTTACSTDDCRRAAEIVNTGRIDLSKLIGARFPLKEAVAAFQVMEKGEALKVILEP